MPFELTLEQFQKLTSSICVYCGSSPSKTVQPRKLTQGSDWGDYKWNGIDRIDSDLGYITTNTVPCCSLCNLAKKDMSLQNFLEHMRKVAQHISSGSFEKLLEQYTVKS